jgi:TonB family protein
MKGLVILAFSFHGAGSAFFDRFREKWESPWEFFLGVLMKTHLLASIVLCGVIVSGCVGAVAQTTGSASDSPPRLDTSGVNLQPNYPEGTSASGSPEIVALVRDNGTVSKVALAKSSGSTELDSAAANAVMHWKFIPAMEHGQPVSGKAVVQVVFRAPDEQ